MTYFNLSSENKELIIIIIIIINQNIGFVKTVFHTGIRDITSDVCYGDKNIVRCKLDTGVFRTSSSI